LLLRDLVSDDDDLAMAAITAAELLVGALLGDPQRRRARARSVEGVLARLPIEAYELAVARHHAPLIAATRGTGRPRGSHDLIIAATAISTRRAVVTTDASAFEDLPGVEVHHPKRAP